MVLLYTHLSFLTEVSILSIQRLINALLAAGLIYFVVWFISRVVEKKFGIQDLHKQKALDKGFVATAVFRGCFKPNRAVAGKLKNKRVVLYDYEFGGRSYQYKKYVGVEETPLDTVSLYFLKRPGDAAEYGSIKGSRTALLFFYILLVILFYFVIFANMFGAYI